MVEYGWELKWRKRSHGQTRFGIEIVPIWYPAQSDMGDQSGKEVGKHLIYNVKKPWILLARDSAKASPARIADNIGADILTDDVAVN